MTLVANLRKLCAGPLKVPQSECQQPSQPNSPAIPARNQPSKTPIMSTATAAGATSKPSQAACLAAPHLFETAESRESGEKQGKSRGKVHGMPPRGQHVAAGQVAAAFLRWQSVADKIYWHLKDGKDILSKKIYIIYIYFKIISN